MDLEWADLTAYICDIERSYDENGDLSEEAPEHVSLVFNVTGWSIVPSEAGKLFAEMLITKSQEANMGKDQQEILDGFMGRLLDWFNDGE